MDIAKRFKHGFDRVMTGRVAKTAKIPMTHPGRSSQPKSPSMARRSSVTLEDIGQVPIKKEDDEDSAFASASQKSMIATGLGSTFGEQQSTGSCKGQKDEKKGSDDEMTDENAQSDFKEDWETTKSLSPGGCSGQPIPSIEADEDDTAPSVPYLHGAAKTKKDAKSLRIIYLDEEPISENDQDPIEDELEYDELEEALIEESEDNLLIAEDDLRDYIKHKLTIDGIETWPKEAARLYKLLYLRGLYPLMMSTWVWDFFGHPMPDGIFTPRASDDKALIKAYGNGVHGMRVSAPRYDAH